MNRRAARSKGVNQAVAEPLPSLAEPADDDFDALYRACVKRVYAYAATLLRDRSAAEEVTAQAFERAYRKRHTYRPSRGTREQWVFGIVRNAALDELRKRKQTAGLAADPEDADSPTVADHAEASARWATVRAALELLSERERDLIALKFHGGLTNAEIGAALGISETNASTRLSRTISKLTEACS